jgi:hypothetical protein
MHHKAKKNQKTDPGFIRARQIQVIQVTGTEPTEPDLNFLLKKDKEYFS